MGLPFSRVEDLKMPRRISLTNVQKRPSNIPTTISRVKSVFSLGKSKISSRHSQSHISLSLPTVIRNSSQATSRNSHGESYHNSYTLTRTNHQNPYHSSQTLDGSSYSSRQGSFNLLHPPTQSFTSTASEHHTPWTGSARSRLLVIDHMGNLHKKGYGKLSSIKSDEDLSSKVSVDFDYMVSHLEKLRNMECSQNKAKLFVTAWRNGLAYPHTKKYKILTDIPTAATSHCKSGITYCERFYRRRVKSCLGRASYENLLADLVHKESLEKFINETEQFHATSSILIREDLKRKLLFDSVHHADSAEKLEDREKVPDDEDMQITVQINIPPPVHIEYNPQQNLFEKDVEKMTSLGLLKNNSGELVKFNHLSQ